jgi:hypothetical protein
MRMQFFLKSRTGVLIATVLTAVLCQSVAGQEAQNKEVPSRDAKGLPPRATPADYQTHGQAGTVMVAADFAGHGVPTPESVFSTEEYIVVEVGLFGPAAARLNLSYKDFSLRINGKKASLPAQPYEAVFRSLKDPEWAPPVPQEKSKSGIGGGGQGDSPPAPVHMPIGLELAMEQKVKRASIPEGDRLLPEAGLIFFQHGGKISGIHSIELIYNGAAGKATLTLQP